MTNHELPGIPQKRTEVFMQAWRAATKCAVTWMHGHAEAMRDPHAKRVMNGAAFDFGQQMKRAWQGDATLAPDLLVSSVDLVVEARHLRGSVDDLRAALEGLLRHSCIADAAPGDKDAEDRAAERAAWDALARTKRGGEA